MKKLAFLALALIPLASVASAENRSFDEYLIEENISLTNIKSNAIVKIKPDTFRSVIEFTSTQRDATEAQAELNNQIALATSLVKQSGLEYKLQGFNTYKEYKSGKFTARQAIVLEDKSRSNIESTTTTLQQNNGKVVNTSSFVSPEAKQAYFEQLFKTAKSKAEAKANFIVKSLNAKSYNITRIDYYMNERSPNYRAMATFAESASPKSANIEVDNSKKELRLELTMSIAIDNK